MYTFSIEKGRVPLIEVKVIDIVIERDAYLRGLVEKCFERVFSMVKEEKKEENSSEEVDLEDDE